jgi:hypothetical protein
VKQNQVSDARKLERVAVSASTLWPVCTFLTRSRDITLADGHYGPRITHKAVFDLSFGDDPRYQHTESIEAYVTTLSYDLMLGRTWLEDHEPQVRWSTGVVVFAGECCREHNNNAYHAPVATENYYKLCRRLVNA